jgi:hypothetical protein
MKSFFTLSLCWLVFQIGAAQGIIYLQNPSFEDKPRKGGEIPLPIKGWTDCGITQFLGESPPDIHPVPGGAWDVVTQAHDGKTYLSLVTRWNNSHESVAQKLQYPLEQGKCYQLSVYLAISPAYKSGTQRSMRELENFSNPVVLRIWGGKNPCEKFALIAQSDPVDHPEWKEYSFDFTATADFHSITVEAYYANDMEAYNGHILVDKFSPIVEINCE